MGLAGLNQSGHPAASLSDSGGLCPLACPHSQSWRLPPFSPGFSGTDPSCLLWQDHRAVPPVSRASVALLYGHPITALTPSASAALFAGRVNICIGSGD